MAESAPALLDLVTRHVPARPAREGMPSAPAAQPSLSPRPVRPLRTRERGPLPPARPSQDAPAIELAYTVDARADKPRRLLSATRSMSPTASRPSASTAPSPIPRSSFSRRPWLPSSPRSPPTARICPPASSPEGLLSDAQLESVIYAGEAHVRHLAGRWNVNESLDGVAAARDDDASAVRFRRGWFLGDGTGAGKGRQVAGILLDNWLKGRRRAVWISKSDKARRIIPPWPERPRRSACQSRGQGATYDLCSEYDHAQERRNTPRSASWRRCP